MFNFLRDLVGTKPPQFIPSPVPYPVTTMPPPAWCALLLDGKEIKAQGYERQPFEITFHPEAWNDRPVARYDIDNRLYFEAGPRHDPGIKFQVSFENKTAKSWPPFNHYAVCSQDGEIVRVIDTMRHDCPIAVTPILTVSFMYYLAFDSHGMAELVWVELLRTQDLRTLNRVDS